MHPSFLKIILPSILPFITHIFNSIIKTCEYPSQWKRAKVIPIPKTSKGNEFRPISILPFLSKIFERVIQKQLNVFLIRSELLTPKQSGFRKNNSCLSALLSVSEAIRKAIDLDRITFLILLDFSKAFDMVNHIFFCQKLLHKFNFSCSAVKLLYSYLTNRVQTVVFNNVNSEFLPVKCGVPQGSILGPLIFSMYVNELPELVSHCSVRMYADDTQLYLSCPLGLIDHSVACLNEDLDTIDRWSIKNSLQLNPKKSKCLIISKNKVDVSYFPQILLKKSPIAYVESAKNLGVIFNRTLTWEPHVYNTVAKAYGVLRTLWPVQNIIPLKVRALLVKTLFLPLLTYGCEIFCHLNYESKRKLTVVFNSAVRYVYGLRRFDRISQHVSQFFGMTFDNFLKYRSVTFFSNILITRQPVDLYNEISFLNSNRSLNVLIPHFSCTTSERQFFVSSARIWNSLPREIKELNCTRKIRKELKKYFCNL